MRALFCKSLRQMLSALSKLWHLDTHETNAYEEHMIKNQALFCYVPILTLLSRAEEGFFW